MIDLFIWVNTICFVSGISLVIGYEKGRQHIINEKIKNINENINR
jgi:hypothetical protein